MSLLPLLTNQIVLDTVVAHLIKQGKRAYGPVPLRLSNPLNNADGCMYRAPDGCRCAVGVLIPDELYEARFEGEAIRMMLNMSEDLRTHFVDVDVNLLRDLQVVHDTGEHWSDQGFTRNGVFELDRIAGIYGLEFTMPEGVRI